MQQPLAVRAAQEDCRIAEHEINADAHVYLALGQAVARAQEVEVVMVRLLEQQHQDTSLPLDDRWDEISGWLDLTGGQLRKLLGVPPALACDLEAAVGRRNRVAHSAWMLYSVGQNRQESADTHGLNGSVPKA